MRQRWLLNLALLVAVLILATVVYTLENKEPIKAPKLTNLATAQIQNIQIERADAEPISFAKDGLGRWQITAPLQLPAASFQVERLLEILGKDDYQKLETTGPDLTAFKLEPPLAKVKFDKLTVAFGDSSPMNDGKRYVLIKQNIYLLTDTLYYTLTGDALTFASLIPLGNNAKITELKMPDYHLISQDGKWELTTTFSSEEIESSQDAINALINNWQNASAYKVERHDSEASSGQGQIEITLLGQEQPLHFEIVGKTSDLVLARPEKGVQYQLAVNQVGKLLHLPTKSDASTDITAPPPEVTTAP